MLKAPRPYQLFLLGVFSLFYSLFYIFPNFHPLFRPVPLPVFSWEKAIAFLPWTVLIYLSDYLYMACAIYFASSREAFHTLARRVFLVLALGGFFFWFFPTVMARPDRITSGNVEIDFFLGLVRSLDKPTNCFPSMHVAFTTVGFLSLCRKGPRFIGGFGVWGLLIIGSVLTTKQHYVWDILGGLGLVLAGVYLDRWLMRWPVTRAPLRAWENTRWWTLSLHLW